MLQTLQKKIHWVEQVSHKLLEHIHKKRDNEIDLLDEELQQGLHWITRELKKIYSPAAQEFYEWAIQNENSFNEWFMQDPNAFDQNPWELISRAQRLIPARYMHDFYYAAQNLYRDNEMLRADKAFRILTLIDPQNADYWMGLGLAQQQRIIPEFALISFTCATIVDIQNPFPYYYKAQSWLQLKGWDLAKKEIEACVDKIGSNQAWPLLKGKCQAFLEVLRDVKSIEKYMPIPGMFQDAEFLPGKAIENLHSNKQVVPSLTPLSQEQWKRMLDDLEKHLDRLAKQLNGVNESFRHEISTLNFFEKQSLILSNNEVTIPISFFSHIYPWSLGLFFGELGAGISISSENKNIMEEKQSHHPFKTAHIFSSIIDQNQPIQKQSLITKYVYVYEKSMDIAINQKVKNPAYGTSESSYQDVREDHRIRVSRFFPEDIIGKSILDCGCNEGGILFECRNLGAGAITGFDLNEWCINRAKEKVVEQNIADANFYVGDMENRAILSTLPMSDTVLLLAILDTSYFINKTAVIANLSRFARHTMYYEGHKTLESHVARMYELLIATDFTRIEYLGRFSGRLLIRCTREILEKGQLPPHAVTSDASDAEMLKADEIYLFTDSPMNPPFSNKCNLIQFVRR